jgi:hypothetical protein
MLLKARLNKNHMLRYKNEIRCRPSHVTLEARSPLLPGRCSFQLRKSYAGLNMVHWPVERGTIEGHKRKNRRKKPLRKTYSCVTSYTINTAWAAFTANPGLRGEKPKVSVQSVGNPYLNKSHSFTLWYVTCYRSEGPTIWSRFVLITSRITSKYSFINIYCFTTEEKI